MIARHGLAVGLALGLVCGCATPIRLLEAPRAEASGAATILAVDIRVWDRFGRQSLPLPEAGRAVTTRARELIAARVPAPTCAPAPAGPDPVLEEVLALYQQVATAWLADPDAGRAGLGIGPGLKPAAGACGTALILIGQQLPRPGEAPSWLTLGAVGLADGRLLRLAALTLRPEEDLRRPRDLSRRIDQLLDRVYR